MRKAAVFSFAAAGLFGTFLAGGTAQQQPTPAFTPVRAIERPATPLPSEARSANVTRFSFIAYGDTRGQGDGQVIHPEHSRLVDGMIQKIKAASSTPSPIGFVLQSGDAVAQGQTAEQWNISFVPIINKLTRESGVPYFFAVGNHDVGVMPPGHPDRSLGLHNTLSAMANVIPPEGAPRRLNGYPTYAFGYGNLFAIAFDSNIASDPFQLAWVTSQLEHLDRSRYHHVVAFFHHPPFSSGPHGGDKVEPQSAAIRDLYMPLFRRHHVRMTVAGHDHLFDHWVEHYADAGTIYRMDDLVTGGGGAPIYAYKGEPDLQDYQTAGQTQDVRVEHLTRPGPKPEDNPHHFVIVHVDGDNLSVDVVGIAGSDFRPYDGRSHSALSDHTS